MNDPVDTYESVCVCVSVCIGEMLDDDHMGINKIHYIDVCVCAHVNTVSPCVCLCLQECACPWLYVCAGMHM